MKDTLAEQLLVRVMGWDATSVAEQLPVLQALSTLKYDDYQQFSPGMRFVESLASWLRQFSSAEEREMAYSLVLERLVFISNAELAHFVSISFPDYIRPFLIRQAALTLGSHERFARKIVSSLEYKLLLRQSLFLGLSDGAHLDMFRRSNSQISHEQVSQTYDISAGKAADMLDKLCREIEFLLKSKPPSDMCKFRSVFLLDDFSASGISYFSKKKDDSGYSGKVFKFLERLFLKLEFDELINRENVSVHAILYIATDEAVSRLRSVACAWLKENNLANSFKVACIQALPGTIRIGGPSDQRLLDVLRAHHDPDIETDHYKVGKHDQPFLGFDQCALPVVMSHNSPNNSLPILWTAETVKFTGLFPRVTRHKGGL
jgi:hypothetical protein